MAESTAIVQYIINRHGKGRFAVQPAQSNYPDYLYWLQFNNNAQAAFLARFGGVPADSVAGKALGRREKAYYSFLEQRLGESDYLAGPEFTAADIMSVFNLTTLPMFGGASIDNLPNATAYVERIGQRPAYIKAMSIAGPEAKPG